MYGSKVYCILSNAIVFFSPYREWRTLVGFVLTKNPPLSCNEASLPLGRAYHGARA